MNKFTAIKRFGVLILILVFISALAGCANLVQNSKDKDDDSAGASSGSNASQASDETTAGGDESGSDGTTQAAGDEEFEVEDLSSLQTYHHLMTVQPEGEGTPSNTVEEFRDIPGKARHVMTTMYIEGQQIVTETIQIDNIQWLKMPNSDTWFKQELDDDSDVDTGDITTIDAADMAASMQYLGEESKNGFNCKKFTMSIDNGEMLQNATIWVANQGGIPKIQISALHEITYQSGEQSGKKTTMIFDVLEINQPVDIQPPENVEDN